MKRKYMVILGVCLIGLGVALLNLTGFGTDPFSCMNLAVSSHLPISYGMWQLLLNILLLGGLILLKKTERKRTESKIVGFGTVFNMAGCGFLMELFTKAYDSLGGMPVEGFFSRILLLLLAVIVLCLGCSLYMTANLGSAPYDFLGVEIASKIGKSFRVCRITTDVVCVIIGIIFGGKAGIGTAILAFGTGPIVQFFHETVSEPFLYGEKGGAYAARGVNQSLQ